MQFRRLWCLALVAACSTGSHTSSTAASPASPFVFSAEASADAIPDSAATTKPALTKPGKRRYPSAYERKQIGGMVVYEFVVTESGTVDPTTIRVLSSTAPEFSAAGMYMVAESRFSPGEVEGKPVRVRVKQRVTWNSPSDKDCQWTGGTDLLPPKCIPPSAQPGS